MVAFSAAAMVALALAVVTWFRAGDASKPPTAAIEIATIQKIAGRAVIAHGVSAPQAVAESGQRVRAGDRLETSAGSRVALVFPGGAVAKLDEQSSIALDAAGALTLSRGAVFIDAGPGSGNPDLYVTTPLGVVRHVGTQFEVRIQDGGVRVRVREGTIAFERAGSRWLSRAGEALVLTAGREPERIRISTSGDEWSWLDELAAPFTLEGATLGSFLKWINRHHGLRWEYHDPAMRDRVERIVLHGSIDGLTAEEALEAVLPACGLTFRRKGDLLMISALTVERRSERPN